MQIVQRSFACWALLFVVATAPLAIFVGCSRDGDEPSTENISEIAGTWTATKATFKGIDVDIEN